MKSLLKNLWLSIGIVAFSACSINKAEEVNNIDKEKPNVITASVKAVNYSDMIRTTGYLAYNKEYKMGFKTGGIVQSVMVKGGQYVKEGEILATLKLDEIEAKASQAKIAVEKAERDYKRIEALFADSVATLEQMQNAKSQLQNAEMNLQTANFNYQQSKIVAPSIGIVQKVLLEENEAAAPGNPVIVFGAENTGKVLIANISDADIVKIKVGDEATIHFDPYPKTIFRGKVMEIAGMATPSTGTYEVKILVNDIQQQLKAGFIGSTSILSSINQQWYRIPVEALVSANDNVAMVYIADHGTARQKNVTVERILSDAILVSGDISEGDMVVISGQHRLSGDSIEIKEL